MAGGGPLELLGGVLRVPERLPRPPRVGVRPQVDVGVAQQRQNRVVERRRRQLDLAARGRVAVLGNDPVQQLELDLAQQLLVVLGEAAALGDQRADPRVAVQVERIDPGELVPDLQVAQIVER